MHLLESRPNGSILVSQLVDELLDICGDVDRLKIEARVSAVLALYEIRPKKPAAGHPDLLEKIELYMAAKKLEGFSPNSVSGYSLELQIFAENVPKPVSEITTADLRLYLSNFNKLKPSSISKKLSILKSFFGWLTAEEILARDPARKIKPMKKEKPLPKSLTIEELEMIREHCNTLRQRAFIEVFYSTGGRLNEIQQLNKQDIDWVNMSTKVQGKGNKEREVYLSYKSTYHLKKYLESRNDDCPSLFVTERKPYRRLSARGIQKEIKKIAVNAGIQKNVHPHIFRHTFATLTLNNGAELAAVQQLLGHENPSTTQIYAQISDEKRKETHKKYLIQ